VRLIVSLAGSISNKDRRLSARFGSEFQVPGTASKRNGMPGEHKMLTILLVILLLMALGALPTWPYSREWGYYPSSGLGIVVVIVLVLLLMGRI
jgi:Protein of unknown function (DUF3309)